MSSKSEKKDQVEYWNRHEKNVS